MFTHALRTRYMRRGSVGNWATSRHTYGFEPRSTSKKLHADSASMRLSLTRTVSVVGLPDLRADKRGNEQRAVSVERLRVWADIMVISLMLRSSPKYILS